MTKLLFTSLMLLTGITALADLNPCDDAIYIKELSMRPGDTRFVEIYFNNSIPWIWLSAEIELPEGLEFVKFDADELDGTEYNMERLVDSQSEELVFLHQGYSGMSNKLSEHDYMVHNNYYNTYINICNIFGFDWCTWMFNHLDGQKLIIDLDNYDPYKVSIICGQDFPIAIVKIKANDNFEAMSTITLRPVRIGSWEYHNGYTGQETEIMVDYEGVTSKAPINLRPVNISDVNAIINVMVGKDNAQSWGWYDANNDNIIDITDINNMINELVGKCNYDVPIGNNGHDTTMTEVPDER